MPLCDCPMPHVDDLRHRQRSSQSRHCKWHTHAIFGAGVWTVLLSFTYVKRNFAVAAKRTRDLGINSARPYPLESVECLSGT